MPHRITVYTIILGGYDNLRPPDVIEEGVRYVCFSDEMRECPPWEIQPAYMPYKNWSRDSRIPKILPHLFFESEYTIYHDGCFVMSEQPSLLIERELQGRDLAMFRHPCRKSIYEEMDVCEREGIGYGEQMINQIGRYRELGVNSGLWAGGFIIRRDTEAVRAFNEKWWVEYINGCPRDQIALPAALKLSGIGVSTINADLLMDKTRVRFCFHAAFLSASDNGSFWADRQEKLEIRRRLEQLCLPI